VERTFQPVNDYVQILQLGMQEKKVLNFFARCNRNGSLSDYLRKNGFG